MNATANSITKILGIGEKNLKFVKEQYEIIKGIKYMVIYADLTYTATQCPHCNSGEKDIIKHGTKLVKVLENKASNNPLYFKLRKQRFLCKKCKHTFVARTSLTKKGCFISNDVKKSIAMSLTKQKSMTLIAEEHYVSINTVIRVLKNEVHKSHKFYLPEVLGIDEFKSLKSVDSAMSVILTDQVNNVILDLYPDRRKRYLKEYLMSFSKAARENVKILTTDMYNVYIDLCKDVFPNATVVLDKFHIVQMFTREMNKARIKAMKKLNPRKRDYKLLKRYWKILLAKQWKLEAVHFYKYTHYKKLTNSLHICQDMLEIDDSLREAYEFYQLILHAIYFKNIDGLKILMDMDPLSIPPCFRTAINSLKEHEDYVLNALKTDYNNAFTESKNNKIKVLKRISYGFRSFENMKLRVMLMESVKFKSSSPNGKELKTQNSLEAAA